MSRHTLKRTVALISTLGLVPSCFALDDWYGQLEPPPSSTVTPVTPPSDPPDPPATPRGPSAKIFRPQHVAEIEITMDEADWQQLRFEGKGLFESFFTKLEDRIPDDYTTFEADVEIDGRHFSDVAIEKYGFVGGIGTATPALALDFAQLHGRPVSKGLQQLTLRNLQEDPSAVRQCLGFELIAQAGYPASRCNFARVRVNGEELGTYVNVETVNAQMLQRHFEDSSGALYFGEVVDFEPVTQQYIRRLDGDGDERAEIEALVDAIQIEDDAESLQRISQLVDLERFRTFWALETLLGHWDGYSQSSNNYFVYLDPSCGRLSFLPWDLDQTFEAFPPWVPNATKSTLASGRLTNRLYNIAAERELYRQELRRLLEQLWDVPELLARVDELAALSGVSDEPALARLRTAISEHAELLLAELEQPAPEVPPLGPFTSPPPIDACTALVTPISGQFDTVFAENPYLSTPRDGVVEIASSLDGTALQSPFYGLAGPNPFVPSHSSVVARTELPSGQELAFTLLVPNEQFTPDTTVPFFGWETWGVAVLLGETWEDVTEFGYISNGSIELHAASQALGGQVSGSFEGELFQFICARPTPTP